MQKKVETEKSKKKGRVMGISCSLEAFLKGDNKALVIMLKQTDISWEDVK